MSSRVRPQANLVCGYGVPNHTRLYTDIEYKHCSMWIHIIELPTSKNVSKMSAMKVSMRKMLVPPLFVSILWWYNAGQQVLLHQGADLVHLINSELQTALYTGLCKQGSHRYIWQPGSVNKELTGIYGSQAEVIELRQSSLPAQQGNTVLSLQM